MLQTVHQRLCETDDKQQRAIITSSTYMSNHQTYSIDIFLMNEERIENKE
jgi:hypothetical protein